MATVTRTYLVDDLDESEEDVENVLFALDGTNYEIDLSAANAGRLREKLARFIDAASAVKVSKSAPAKRGTKGKAVPSNRDQVQAIREWAKAAGYEVSGRGRISRAIQGAFDAAH
jgi:Lsr2